MRQVVFRHQVPQKLKPAINANNSNNDTVNCHKCLCSYPKQPFDPQTQMNVPLKMLFHTKGITFSAVFSIWLICCCLPGAKSLVVPQELPSILSLIYSNIPPIKKGTDSRLGFGFRLGNHADFQFLVELGPQKNTRPIGEEADSENSFNKRQVSKAHRDYLLRKQAQETLKQRTSNTITTTSTTIKSSEPTAASWLENWSKTMTGNVGSNNNYGDSSSSIAVNKKKLTPKLIPNAGKKHQQAEKSTPALANAEEAMMQLQMLYRMATTTSSTTTAPPASTDLVNSDTDTPITIVTPVPQFRQQHPSVALFKGGPLNLGGPAGFLPRPLEESSLQTISEQQSVKKSKSEITKELMDVNLEEGE